MRRRFDDIFASMPETSLLLTLVIGMMALLLFATVVRRLRDAGISWVWAIPPWLFFAVAAIITPDVFDYVNGPGTEPSLLIPMNILFPLLFVNNLLYLASLIYLVTLLTKQSVGSPE